MYVATTMRVRVSGLGVLGRVLAGAGLGVLGRVLAGAGLGVEV